MKKEIYIGASYWYDDADGPLIIKVEASNQEEAKIEFLKKFYFIEEALKEINKEKVTVEDLEDFIPDTFSFDVRRFADL